MSAEPISSLYDSDGQQLTASSASPQYTLRLTQLRRVSDSDRYDDAGKQWSNQDE